MRRFIILLQALIAKIDFITSEKTALEGDLHDLLVQKEELDLRIVNLETDTERYRNQVKTDANTALFDLLREYYKVYNIENLQ